jgi:predicted acetyltransferase
MAFQLRWAQGNESDRIALARLRCYGSAEKDLELFQQRLRDAQRCRPGDHLLAEQSSQPVGTATSLPLKMWARGSCIPCQGVAWVGTIKTMRRRGNGSGGIATAIMTEILRHGRERGDIVSALMPFRVSFYEHFGYGIVERRCEWTLPIALLPTGPFDGLRFYEPTDFTARAQCLARVNQMGQCDVERNDELWALYTEQAKEGMQFVDRPTADGPVRRSIYLTPQSNVREHLRVAESICEDLSAMKRQLHFLASLRDQYTTVNLTLPADVPLNRLLKETQIPHRTVSHATAEVRSFTRMQLRVLDHQRFLEALSLPQDAAGSAAIAVHECEGTVSRFKLDLHGGKITVSLGGAAEEFSCTDRTWAAIACGDLAASDALHFGLADGSDKAAQTLNVLARGPVPFCNEYF